MINKMIKQFGFLFVCFCLIATTQGFDDSFQINVPLSKDFISDGDNILDKLDIEFYNIYDELIAKYSTENKNVSSEYLLLNVDGRVTDIFS